MSVYFSLVAPSLLAQNISDRNERTSVPCNACRSSMSNSIFQAEQRDDAKIDINFDQTGQINFVGLSPSRLIKH